MHATAISVEEKRSALQQLLNSVALRRADQLRRFLEFVVEEEIAGRGAQIREWDIAVRALNRPSNYTPETDSTVRTRAHALRQRLAEYYRLEAPDAEVRLDLPKGGYSPRFFRANEPVETVSDPIVEPLPFELAPAPVEPPRPRSSRWGWALAGLVAGIVLSAISVVLLRERGIFDRRSEIDIPPEIAEVWGPILNSPSPVKVVMSSPFQLWVRDYRNHPTPLVDPVDSPPMPNDQRLIRSYGEQMRLHPDSKLYLHGNSAGALWGDAAGVQVATRFLGERGVRSELVPEKSVKSGYVFRNDSYLAFGRSEYSPLMSGKVPRNGFDVQYLPSIRRHAIALLSDPAKGPIFLPTPGTHALNYGLITVLRDTADDGHSYQAMFFAGVISNGAQAAVEYMTTPRHLKELLEKLRASGIKTWPRAIQIVVKSETTEFYPVRTEYESHLVLKH